jgi:rhodanese/phosphatase family RapZ-like protein
MTETTTTYDPLGTAIGRAGRELAELARRRLAREVRINYPTATALEIEPIDTGGHCVLRVLDAQGAALVTADEEDLDWGPQAGTDLVTVERYGEPREDLDRPLTIDLGRVPGAAGDENETTAAAEMVVVSFGYSHGSPPPAHVVLDVRALLTDPAEDPLVHEYNGLDEPMSASVLDGRGAHALIEDLELTAITLHAMTGPDTPVSIAIGSGLGRYRAPSLAAELGRRLDRIGYETTVAHRHAKLPVVDDAHVQVVLLTAARAAARLFNGTFTLEALMGVADQLRRGPAWLRCQVRLMVKQGLLADVDAGLLGRLRVVNQLHRLVSGDTVYAAGTDLDVMKKLADRLYRERNWQGDVWETEWQRRDGAWSLVASDGDEDDDGDVVGFHTGVRIETVDVDADGALAAGQNEHDVREFVFTCTAASGNHTSTYRLFGQVDVEAEVAASARLGDTALAVLDFDTAEATENAH